MKAPAWDLDAWIASFVAEASSDANVEKFVQAVNSAILEQTPEIAENARLSEELHASTKSHWRSFLTVLEREDPDLLLPPQAIDVAVSMARRGLDIGILLKVYRVAADATWEFLVTVADAVPDDGPDRADVLKFLWGRASRWINESIDRLVLAYFTEREAVFEGAFARRNETIQSLLRGDTIPVDKAAQDLGHPIRAQQTGLVLWFDEASADGSSADLEAIAQAIAREVTAPRPLTVAPGSRELWAWLATRQAPDLAGLTAIVERSGARAAIGGSSPGIEGFRATHREAVAAQRLMLRSGRGGAVTVYADVELACLMSEQPEAAHRLVERELGKLAEPDPALDVVRETLSHYLRNGSNIVLTATQLYVHRNTVRYRLDQAEELVGHPLAERRTEMDVALRLVAAGVL